MAFFAKPHLPGQMNCIYDSDLGWIADGIMFWLRCRCGRIMPIKRLEK